MRLIDADALLAFEKFDRELTGEEHTSKDFLMMIKTAPTIDPESLRPKGEWISVEDRLPEEYRDEYGELIPFLVCESGTEYPCRALFDGKKWGDGLSLMAVTHWMPLPEPPKGE